MTLIKRLMTNTAYLATAEIVNKVMLAILVIYAASSLGPEYFGRYAFSFAFASVFGIFCTLGINAIIIKDVARDKSLLNKYFNGLFSLSICLSAITLVIIILTISNIGYELGYKLIIFLACLSVVLDHNSEYIASYFKALEQMKYITVSSIIRSVVIFILGGMFLYLGFGLIWFILAFIVASSLQFVYILFIASKKLTTIKIKIDLPLWKKILKPAMPLAVMGLFGLIYFRVDTLIIAYLLNDQAVGIYSSAFQIVASLLFIPGVFLAALFPILANQYKNIRIAFFRTMNLSIKSVILIAIPIGLGINFIASKIIDLLYSEEYITAIVPLKILSLMIICMFINYLYLNLLISIDKQNKIPLIMGFCLFLNVILNFIFIPKYGINGAAMATLISNIMASTLYYLTLKYYLKQISLIKHLIKPIIAGVGTYLIIPDSLSLFLVIPLFAGIYFIILLLLGTFKKEEINLICELLNRKPLFK